MQIDSERLIGLARSLVTKPRLSGEQGAVVETILREMGELGFDRAW